MVRADKGISPSVDICLQNLVIGFWDIETEKI